VYHNAIKKQSKNDEELQQSICCRLCSKVATTSQSFDSTDEIAIIYAQGEIMGGEGDVTVIEGSDASLVARGSKKQNVKAIVLALIVLEEAL
jgi:protease-4